MKQTKQVFYYLALCLNILLIFLSTFSDKLVLPEWLGLSGRLHPVFLHFPLALTLVTIGLYLAKKQLNIKEDSIFKLLFFISSISAAVTGLFGLFLSKEGGYDENILTQHQWFGVSISLLSYFSFLSFYHSLENKWINSISIISILVIIWGSHLGGELTHGEDFLSFKSPEKIEQVIITDSSVVYTSMIEPILKAKCFSCHNEQKSKGGLVMSSIEKLLKGGENGKLWIPGDPLNSHILQRLELPEEDKEHMPPKGKIQVTTKERLLIEEWIRRGADMKKRIMDYPAQDSFRIFLAGYQQKSSSTREYSFAVASAADIESAQSPYCYVSPVAAGSPALQVRFLIRSAFTADQIKNLNKVADNIVQMNLSNMTVKDEDLTLLNSFQNLEILNLNGTDVTGKGLAVLKANKSLASIALSNTKVNLEGFKQLINSVPSLKQLYCWNTVVNTSTLKQLQSINPKVSWYLGYIPDDKEMLQLTPALLTDNDKFVLGQGDSVRFKHPMPGAVIKYTLDGSGPDSITSMTYTKPLVFKTATRVRTITTLPGWLTSDTTDHTFFVRSVYKPSYIRFLQPPDKNYMAQKEPTLFDSKKGEAGNFREGFIGVKENHFDMLCGFNTPQAITEILVSTLRNTPSYIMPPERLELWAGTDSVNLKKIAQLIPPKLSGHQYNKIELQRLPVNGTYKFFRIKVFNITKLPSWHEGRGQKGWVFIDEVFFN